ncbi:hypothetical protein ACLKA6_015073 [Drosophila palustris]
MVIRKTNAPTNHHAAGTGTTSSSSKLVQDTTSQDIDDANMKIAALPVSARVPRSFGVTVAVVVVAAPAPA